MQPNNGSGAGVDNLDVLLDDISVNEKSTAPDRDDFFGGLKEWDAAAVVSGKAAAQASRYSVPPPSPAAPPIVTRVAEPPTTAPPASTPPPPRATTLLVGNLSKKGPAAKPPPGVADVRVDRQTAFGNPFPMGADGHDEHFRDAVCDACEELLADPLSADVDAIARKHGLRVDSRFKHMTARRALSDALAEVEARAGAGESLRFMCWCAPKRCHGNGIAKTLRDRLLRAGTEVVIEDSQARTPRPTADHPGVGLETPEPALGRTAAGGDGKDRGVRGGGRSRARGRSGVSRLQ